MFELEFEEKFKYKVIMEKVFYNLRNNKECNLLKGSLDRYKIDKINEYIIENDKLYYNGNNKEMKKMVLIGKIVGIFNSKNELLNSISFKNFEDGLEILSNRISENRNIVLNDAKENIEGKEKLEEVMSDFKKLGKSKEIEKGKLIIDIEELLNINKELGKKGEIWKELGISPTKKSLLTKKYKLFEEMKENLVINEGENNLKITIENLTDAKLKEITKQNATTEEKEEEILKIMIK